MLSHQQAVRPAGQGKLKNSGCHEEQQVALLHFYIFIALLAGCASSEPDCSQPQVFCAGLVTDTAGRDDLAYNQSAWEGMQQAHASGTADRIAVIESVDLWDYERNLQVFVDAGYDVIVSVGGAMKTTTDEVAADHPEVFFIGIEQLRSASSLASITWQAWFLRKTNSALLPVPAAMLTDSGKVGAVLASEAIVQISSTEKDSPTVLHMWTGMWK